MTVTTLLGAARALLLDFDGPITSLLPPPANLAAADDARRPLVASGVVLPADIAATTDHLAVLRYAALLGPVPLEQVEQACIGAETQAAAVSEPTSGGHGLITAVWATGRPVVIVSNNAPEAVRTYLVRFGLTSYVRGVIGRARHRPEQMKPDPRLVAEAARAAGADPARCVLVGDTVSDVQAAVALGMPCIGYAESPDSDVSLGLAGAAFVVRSMDELGNHVLHDRRISRA